MEDFLPKPLGVKINLNGKESDYLDFGEECYFFKEDVAWYEYAPQHRAFDAVAHGTIYLTNKRILLYDPGFSNIWTKMSKDGDYREQVKIKLLNDITTPMFNIPIGGGRLKGPFLEANGKDCWLPPSHRKYKNRRNPLVFEYGEMDKMVEIIMRLGIVNKMNEN